MNNIDYLDLDGHLLRLFVLIFEEGSVTKAAERLAISQSGASHSLEKLRQIVGDPLFVRSGRGIAPTHYAEDMVDEVRRYLRTLQSFSEQKGFDLTTSSGRFTIAANDLLWGVLLADVYKNMETHAPNQELHIIHTGTDVASLLRGERCDLVLTPFLPDGSDFKQQKVIEDEFVCFYDPDVTHAPKSLDDFLSRRHASIGLANLETNPIDVILAAERIQRQVVLQVPTFSGLPKLMKGTGLIAVLPSMFKHTFMAEFDRAPTPLPLNPLTFYQVWHRRDDQRPFHQWMRQLVRKLSQNRTVY